MPPTPNELFKRKHCANIAQNLNTSFRVGGNCPRPQMSYSSANIAQTLRKYAQTSCLRRFTRDESGGVLILFAQIQCANMRKHAQCKPICAGLRRFAQVCAVVYLFAHVCACLRMTTLFAQVCCVCAVHDTVWRGRACEGLRGRACEGRRHAGPAAPLLTGGTRTGRSCLRRGRLRRRSTRSCPGPSRAGPAVLPAPAFV